MAKGHSRFSCAADRRVAKRAFVAWWAENLRDLGRSCDPVVTYTVSCMFDAYGELAAIWIAAEDLRVVIIQFWTV